MILKNKLACPCLKVMGNQAYLLQQKKMVDWISASNPTRLANPCFKMNKLNFIKLSIKN